MSSSAASLLQRASALLAEVAALPVASFADEEVCALAIDAEVAGRFLDAVRATVAAEIEERSRFELGAEGLAVRLGARRGVHLIEQLTRVSQAEAARRTRLGAAIRPRTSFAGDPLPAIHPHVAEAVRSGAMAMDAATTVVRCLDQAARHRADPADLDAAERNLVAQAARDSADLVAVAARAWRAALDPDGSQPREEALRELRGFTLGRERDGLTPFWGSCDPLSAAQLKAAFAESAAPDAEPRFLSTEDAERGARVVATPDGDLVERISDPRTREQRQLDVLLGLLTAGIRSTGVGSTATVMVNVSLDDLASGRGTGWLDDVAEPVSAATVRELACDAGIHRVVLGSNGEVLALGRRERSFNRAQRRALGSRDGGCVWPQCTAPPSWCHAHHIVEWSKGGRTDIDNGALLCSAHHHMLHNSPFTMRMVDGRPRLLAPPWLNPQGEWRVLGRSRVRMTRRLQARLEHAA